MSGPSLRVAVVAGGPSSEAGVSRRSAAGVARALSDSGHRPEVLELDEALAARLVELAPDVVFPAVHGAVGEDGCLQGLLEVLGLPYVGSRVLASALAMSKPHAKRQFVAVGLPLAKDAVVRRGEDADRRAAEIRGSVGRAVVVKPGAGGSAIGVTPIRDADPDSALAEALRAALSMDPVALVEEFLVGKEVTCGVLEDETGAARALPPTLILPKAAGWYDFTSKYGTGGSAHQCPPPFPAPLVERIQRAAVLAHEVLGCRDLSRTDFVVDDDAGTFTVLEVNTLPGMTATSLFPEAALAAGIAFPELCDRLVRRAHARPRDSRLAGVAMPA
ncbi:MAG TPA: D-alanine--D-alanine ligase [Polyangiaceae bacterium]|nr:D-alanine--D-alanine ligase [Polyangiaceae bacterium]